MESIKTVYVPEKAMLIPPSHNDTTTVAMVTESYGTSNVTKGPEMVRELQYQTGINVLGGWSL